MTTPKFSIIVPVYNTEKQLSRCLDSILAQTFSDFECLLVDDGSTDNSPQICDQYAAKDNRFIVFHEINKGVSSARNLGLEHAMGEWITFCDSDDELLIDGLSIYAENIGDSIDLIKAGYNRVNRLTLHSDNISTNNECLSKKDEVFSKYQKSKYFGFLWNSAYKGDLAKRIRFDESITWCEDMLYTLEYITLADKVCFTSKAVYNYYYGTDSGNSTVSNLSLINHDPKMIVDCAIKERNLILRICDCGEYRIPEIQAIFQSKIVFAIVNALRSNEFYYAFKIFKQYVTNYKLAFVNVFKDLLKTSRVFKMIFIKMKI